jgi:sortase A
MRPSGHPYSHPDRQGWLECILWFVGCSALSYCILVWGEARITQARLARIFAQTRADQRQAQPVACTKTPAASKPASLALASSGIPLLARLEIPRIGVSAMVLDGAGSRTLRVGLGHIPGTSRPGQQGNVAIAGHRDTIFRPLRRIKAGDEVVLETPSDTYHYRVSRIEIVDPTDVSVLKSHGQNELTLVTCYPFSYLGRAPKRFIVHSVITP